MRIGVDIRALMEGKTTGVEEYLTNLLHALFHLDRKNEYVLFANSRRPLPAAVYQFRYPNVKYCVSRRSNKVFNLLQKYMGRPKVDEICGGGFDVFFSPHWRTLALSPNVRLVVTFHDLSFELSPEFFTARQRLWHRFMDYRTAAARADRIIAVSRSTKADLIALYGIPEAKVEVIYSGLKEEAAPPETVSNVPDKYFLFFGTFEPRKNLDAVIAAYKGYRGRSQAPLPLVLAGSYGWKVDLRIPEELRPHVLVINNVSAGEKTFLFQRAFALLFLSFYEGFGFPLLEAAGLGVPVISSFGSSLSEIGGDFALLVNPFRVEQIISAMLNLEQDERFYQNMRKRGREVTTRFTWGQSAARTLELFQKLAS